MDFRSLRTRFQLPDIMERMDGKESLKTILNLLMGRTLNTLMTKGNNTIDNSPRISYKENMKDTVHPLRDEYVKDKIFNNVPTKELHDELHQYGEEWVKDRIKEGRAKGGLSDLSKKKTVFFTFAEAGKKKEFVSWIRLCSSTSTVRSKR